MMKYIKCNSENAILQVIQSASKTHVEGEGCLWKK